jgi:hypothetical protein
LNWVNVEASTLTNVLAGCSSVCTVVSCIDIFIGSGGCSDWVSLLGFESSSIMTERFVSAGSRAFLSVSRSYSIIGSFIIDYLPLLLCSYRSLERCGCDVL